MPTELPPPRAPLPPPPAPQSPWRGVQGAILILSLLALLVLFMLPFFSERPGRGRPWRVAITEPQVVNAGTLDSGRLALLQEAMVETSERMLAARLGLSADRAFFELEQEEPEAGAKPASPDRQLSHLARQAEFDEILRMQLECGAERCRALLRRLRSVDGSPEWRRSFSLDPSDLVEAEDELVGELHVAFLKFTRHRGGSRLLIPAEDYETFLRLRIDHRRGLVPPRRAVSITEELRRASPRFTSLHLFEAEMRTLMGEKELAADLLAEAHRISPGDIRPLLRRVPLLIELRRQDEIAEVLSRIEELAPDEPRLPTWREYVAK